MTIAILILAGFIVSLVYGIRFLIKYNQTRKGWYLFWGIVLTFVIPALILFFVFKVYTDISMVYGPNPMVDYGPDPMIAYGPRPS